MNGNEFAEIEKLEGSLWDAADDLRANSKLTAGEYCMPVLGVIFLRHATNRYNEALIAIEADQASGKMPKRPLASADFKMRRALMLPESARYESLLALPKGTDLGQALVKAMEAIEKDFPVLSGQLPKDYPKFKSALLENLLRTFDSETLRHASGDVFGRINEYFLMKFAMQGAQDNGEFFTPPSIVQTIVNVIEPDHGIVFDPACGSGGMFVQSSHFIERHGARASHNVTFYGHEYKTSNLRLALMNLAVHGLEGSIKEANTFYEDPHELFGKCNFVMANPPFNVDKVDAERIKKDRRLPFGLPGVNKDKQVGNGNYLWISYFHSYLNESGRAGFVMSSQASSAGHGEAEVRRKIVETGDVDVMISIRSNFFYTRTVPCELWFYDRAKSEECYDKVLMVDARNVFRKVTRKIYDFSPEQQQNLAAIVWLYRGQTERFVSLVQKYLERMLAEAAVIGSKAGPFRKSYDALAMATAPFIKTLPKNAPLREAVKERDDAAKACFHGLDDLEVQTAREAARPPRWTNTEREAARPPVVAQGSKADGEMGGTVASRSVKDLSACLGDLAALASSCRALVKDDADLVFKLAARVVDVAEKDAEAKAHAAWDNRAIGRIVKDLDASRQGLGEQLKVTAYFERQAHWLLSRFPDGKLVDVLGLVKLVDRKEIEAADWSLTPGRYVGVAPVEEDEDFDFEQTIRDIHIELADLNAEAVGLASTIQKNFEGLGI